MATNEVLLLRQGASPMVLSTGSLRLRRCQGSEIGIADHGEGRNWPAEEVFLATVPSPHTADYLLAILDAVLEGEALTAFLDRVAPFGCPPPPSLIRAYSLPDAPYPSILLREHGDAPAGMGDAYRRFAGHARPHWLAALQETGPGLVPALAWQTGPDRRFVAPDEWAGALRDAGIALPGPADDYLGRGLLLLADPHLTDSWEVMMSLGGVTKVRKITGREFPVWVDLPAHQPALLASPLLTRVERVLAEA
jgi:hypothetical protein